LTPANIPRQPFGLIKTETLRSFNKNPPCKGGVVSGRMAAGGLPSFLCPRRCRRRAGERPEAPECAA
jgi:hypothetical protein